MVVAGSSRRPNIVLLITDQERSHKHWPQGWAEKNLTTHYDCLIGCQETYNKNRSSVHFPNAFTATTECSPSRASLLTSSYPTEHGVKTTPGSLDPRSDLGLGVDVKDMCTMKRPNLMRLLSAPTKLKKEKGDDNDKSTQQQQNISIKGYDVAWKGKWHLSPSSEKRVARESSILKWYGCTSPWNPPDAGHSLWHSSTLGGGLKFNHDGRFLRGVKNRFDSLSKAGSISGDVAEEANRHILVDPYLSDTDSDSTGAAEEVEEDECIFDFLAKHRVSTTAAKEGDEKPNADTDEDEQPFFLIASLVNPHDVWASSCFSNLTDEEFFKETGYHPRDFENLPIDLPPNHKDNLSTKPLIQSILKDHHVFGDLPDTVDDTKEQQCQSDAKRYVRFYAHLHTLVDAEIGALLEALEATGKMDNTIIVRMADHGELALSHGLREKRMQCYEETMGIPLVINYPTGWFDNDDDKQGDDDNNGNAKKDSCTRVDPRLISSIDILPTIAELAGINCSPFQYRGKSLVPVLRDDKNSGVDSKDDEILFTFDEPLAPPGVPGYVRCIRTTAYKYGVYFTIDGKVMEYELYNLEADPYEMKNLAGPNTAPDEGWFHFHDRLTKLMRKMGAVPTEFDWDKLSMPKMYSWG